MPAEMTLWESSVLRVWPTVTLDQVVEPRARRATVALRSAAYQTAYW